MTISKITTEIAICFNDSQVTAASHRKNSLNLQKVQQLHQGESQWEEHFFHEFVRHLNNVLSIKRNDDLYNRLMKFITAFISLPAEKDDGRHERFVENVCRYLFNGVDAKDKHVRTRCCQLISICLSNLNEISADVWNAFRAKIGERLFDKEHLVRIQAIKAMSKIQSAYIDDNNQISVLSLLTEILEHDPHAEVRKAVLECIVSNEFTLKSILSRGRDVDASIRKLLFKKKLMDEIPLDMLTVDQRDEILKDGLMDRDPSVRQSCLDLVFGNWIHQTDNNLVLFLTGLNVVENTKVAEEALHGFFSLVPNMFESFSEAHFETMTPETVLTMKVYCQIKFQSKGSDAVQDLLPDISNFATYLMNYWNEFQEASEEEEKVNLQFIVTQLLAIGELLDFSDEVGRRSMCTLLRELLISERTNDSHVQSAVRFLRLLAENRQDYICMIVEIISEYKDILGNEGIDKKLEKLNIQESEKRLARNLRAMDIIKYFLIDSNDSLSTNPVYGAFLNEFIIPAIGNQYVAIQKAGLNCLGLLALLDQEIAKEYIHVFANIFKMSKDDEIKQEAVKILFDLVLVFGKEFVDSVLQGHEFPQVIKILFSALGSQAIQSTASEGLCKLFAVQMIDNPEILVELLYLYYHPKTESKNELRQHLGFFLNAYSVFSVENQMVLAKSTVPFLVRIFPKLQTMTPLKVAQQLFFWADSSNLLKPETKQDSHSLIALDLCFGILSSDKSDITRFLASLLPKLHLDLSWDLLVVKKLMFLSSHLVRVISDKVSVNNIKKFGSFLMEIDGSNEPMEKEELDLLKQKIQLESK